MRKISFPENIFSHGIGLYAQNSPRGTNCISLFSHSLSHGHFLHDHNWKTASDFCWYRILKSLQPPSLPSYLRLHLSSTPDVSQLPALSSIILMIHSKYLSDVYKPLFYSTHLIKIWSPLDTIPYIYFLFLFVKIIIK